MITELIALDKIIAALAALTPEERRRVFSYLHDRYGLQGDKPLQGET